MFPTLLQSEAMTPASEFKSDRSQTFSPAISPPRSRSAAVPGVPVAELGEEYPVNLRVRNTFLDFPVNRPDSLDDFLQLRQVRSAPGSKVDDLDGQTVEGGRRADEAIQATSAPTVEQAYYAQFAPGPAPISAPMSAPGPARLDLASMLPPANTMPASQATMASGYLVEEYPPRAAPSGVGAPTLGSQKHGMGQCKPCAFVWKGEGCSNGAHCQFCHLCDPGEKKRRAKEKKLNLRAQRGGGFGAGAARLQQIGSSFRNMFS